MTTALRHARLRGLFNGSSASSKPMSKPLKAENEILRRRLAAAEARTAQESRQGGRGDRRAFGPYKNPAGECGRYLATAPPRQSRPRLAQAE